MSTENNNPSFFDASLVNTLCRRPCANQKNALLLASHLIIHLPPRVGAYVLASHRDLAKITSDTTGSETRSQFQDRIIPLSATPCPATSGHRRSSRTGHSRPCPCSPHLCTCLNTDIINRKIIWALVPLAGPGGRRSAKSSLRGSCTPRFRPP